MTSVAFKNLLIFTSEKTISYLSSSIEFEFIAYSAFKEELLAIDGMFVFPLSSYVEVLTPNVMALGHGDFRRLIIS